MRLTGWPSLARRFDPRRDDVWLRMLAVMTFCNVSSGSMEDLRIGDEIGAHGLAEQDIEGRDSGIPFDERRTAAKSLDSIGIEAPHVGSDARSMVVDQHRPIGRVIAGMAGDMDLS